jgi:hypothetical protein
MEFMVFSRNNEKILWMTKLHLHVKVIVEFVKHKNSLTSYSLQEHFETTNNQDKLVMK